MDDGVPPPRLSRATLSRLDPAARRHVRTEPMGVGIVHLGLGSFHRAHQAVYTEDALTAEPGDWGICGVSRRNAALISKLTEQDGLYGVVSRDTGGDRVRVVGVLRDMLVSSAEPARLRDRLAAPTTHIVTITVTEKGYRHSPATGRLRHDDPDVAADLAGGPPRTVVGQLARGLQDRVRNGDAGPLTVLSCDNLPGNGELVKAVVTDFCAALPAREGEPLAAWIEQHVSFPSTVVDRIVPASTDADLAAAARTLGLADQAAVVAEPYRQWVIEDRFAGPRPAWERAGALLVGDAHPYESLKLRLLNASHSALAYLGTGCGHGTVAEAFADPALARVVELVQDELLPTVPDVPGIRPRAYAGQVRERFANQAITHPLEQIAADGSYKLPQRLLGPARELLAAGTTPQWICLAVAGWMHHLCADGGGAPSRVRDPLEPRLREIVSHVAKPAAIVEGLLGLREVFPPELAEDDVFRDTTTYWLERLVRYGVAATVHDL